MSHHSTSFEAEREIPAEPAQELLPQPNPVAKAQRPRRCRLLQIRRFASSCSRALRRRPACRRAWYGWDYWTVGRFQVSTDDAYVKADNTTIAPKVSGYLVDVLVGDNEHVEGRPGAGPHRRPRLQGRARAGQGRCRRRAKPPSRTSRRSSTCSRR